MTLDEARHQQMLSGAVTDIGDTVPAKCEICGAIRQLRASVCFGCKPQVEADMVEAWEIANPAHRWPYKYYSEPFVKVVTADNRGQ